LSFVCSVSVQDYCRSNQSISLKLGVMIGPTNQKNFLTFGVYPVPGTDSRSRFHFPCHCVVGDFRRFISIPHTVTGRFSQHSAKRLTLTRSWIHNILGVIRQTSGCESGNPESNPGSLGWNFGLGRDLCFLSSLYSVYFLSASLYVSKRGAYWDRLCRDWSLVGWLVVGCHARALAKRCILGL